MIMGLNRSNVRTVQIMYSVASTGFGKSHDPPGTMKQIIMRDLVALHEDH